MREMTKRRGGEISPKEFNHSHRFFEDMLYTEIGYHEYGDLNDELDRLDTHYYELRLLEMLRLP